MEQENLQQNEKKLPEYKFSSGKVSASVWQNRIEKDGKQMDVRSVRVEKKYKDNDGNWKSTNSYNIRDLKDLELVSQQVYKYVMLRGEKPNKEVQNG